MKRILWAIMFWATICSAYAQHDLKKITKKDKEKSVVETYYVLKNDRKIKQGDYSRFVNSKKVISGQYTNNKESGIWIFYDSDRSIDLKYDYDIDSVLFVDIKNDTSGLDRPLIYLGSAYEARYIVMINLRYPVEAAENGKSGRIFIDVFVDEKGNVYDYKVHESVYPPLDDEALRVVKLIPQRWLPAIKNGKSVKSEFSFPVSFVLQ